MEHQLRWIDVLYYARYSNPDPYRRVDKTEEEWKEQLTPAQFHILREKGTERAFRNTYCRSFEPGVYVCAACRNPLFDSDAKSHKLSGWPAFNQPVARGAMKYAYDNSHNMVRIEVLCNVCDAHLGHVFPAGPQRAGLRYCINSESLNRTDR